MEWDASGNQSLVKLSFWVKLVENWLFLWAGISPAWAMPFPLQDSCCPLVQGQCLCVGLRLGLCSEFPGKGLDDFGLSATYQLPCAGMASWVWNMGSATCFYVGHSIPRLCPTWRSKLFSAHGRTGIFYGHCPFAQLCSEGMRKHELQLVSPDRFSSCWRKTIFSPPCHLAHFPPEPCRWTVTLGSTWQILNGRTGNLQSHFSLQTATPFCTTPIHRPHDAQLPMCIFVHGLGSLVQWSFSLPQKFLSGGPHTQRQDAFPDLCQVP